MISGTTHPIEELAAYLIAKEYVKAARTPKPAPKPAPQAKTCKNVDCPVDDGDAGLEESGYCFTCAEELACLLADASEEFGVDLDPTSAYYATPKPASPSYPPADKVGEPEAIEIPIDRPDGRRSTHVLSLKGTYHRFAVGRIAEGSEGRQVTDGPMVPGPWAYAYGLASVIDCHGGTGAEIERNQAEQREHEVTEGSRVRIDGVIYRVSVERGEFLNLTEVGRENYEARNPETEYEGELKETAILTWTFPIAQYPTRDDCAVALDEAGYRADGDVRGPGLPYCDEMDFEEGGEAWTVTQRHSWDV